MMDLEHSANVVFSKWVYSICIYGYSEINFYYCNIALRSTNFYIVYSKLPHNENL